MPSVSLEMRRELSWHGRQYMKLLFARLCGQPEQLGRHVVRALHHKPDSRVRENR